MKCEAEGDQEDPNYVENLIKFGKSKPARKGHKHSINEKTSRRALDRLGS